MWRHILPNVFQPVVVLLAIGIGSAILAEAALSFLGVGVTPPDVVARPDDQRVADFFASAPHLLIFPGLAVIAHGAGVPAGGRRPP